MGEMLSEYFGELGHSVRVAQRGAEAILLAQQATPDIVLLDIRLPDTDGYEICRQLRQTRSTEHVPVIFLTVKRERRDRLAGLELGAADYITKPFDVEELALRIRNILWRSQSHAPTNPITGLPEGQPVRERLERMLDEPKWALIVAGLRGYSAFRNTYGFIAADDLARAMSLLIAEVMTESGAGNDYLGHIDLADFVIITTVEQHAELAERCLARLQESIPFFYPAMERPPAVTASSISLMAQVTGLSSKGHHIATLEDLRIALESSY